MSIRAFLISTLILFVMVALTDARGIEVKKWAGELEAGMRIDRSPPVLGDNHIEIELKDSAGKTVTDSKILVNYYMPPMPRMAPMNYTTDAQLRGDKYRAKMNLIMAGPWIIAVKITHGGKTSTAKFNVNAQ